MRSAILGTRRRPDPPARGTGWRPEELMGGDAGHLRLRHKSRSGFSVKKLFQVGEESPRLEPRLHTGADEINDVHDVHGYAPPNPMLFFTHVC